MPMSPTYQQLLSPVKVSGQDEEFILSDGYSDNQFSQKQEQMNEVVDYIAKKGFLPQDLIQNEVAWFYKYGMVLCCLNGIDLKIAISGSITCTLKWKVLM